MKYKGISSILGAIIMIQIVLLSVALIIYFMNLNTKVYITQQTQTIKNLEKAPITILPTTIGPKILSTTSSNSPLIIKYIIYPNGEVMPTNIPITPSGTYINFNGNPWEIIVLNDGAWYNITNEKLIIPANDSPNNYLQIYSPYSYKFVNIKWGNPNNYVKLTYLPTPALFGNDIDPSNWNLMTTNPASIFYPIGYTNATILIHEPQNVENIPIIINTSYFYNAIIHQNPYFDIIIPYNEPQLVDNLPVYGLVGVQPPAGPGIYSNYLPLEFNVTEKTAYMVPVYNVTLHISGNFNFYNIFGVDTGYRIYEYAYLNISCYISIFPVTYNMIYYMQTHNNTLYKYGYYIQNPNSYSSTEYAESYNYSLKIELVSYHKEEDIIASNIEYSSLKLGYYWKEYGAQLNSPCVSGSTYFILPGFNNYTLSDGKLIKPIIYISDQQVNPITNNACYFYSPIYNQVNNNTINNLYINLNNISNKTVTKVIMIISGGNLNYDISGSTMKNIANYSYNYFFNATLGNLQTLIVSITPNNQISIFLYNDGNLIYPFTSYIYYYSINTTNLGVGNSGIIYGNSEGYLQLGYPTLNYYWTYAVYSSGSSYHQYATYKYFKPITSSINYNAAFMIILPEGVYYPYNSSYIS
ncbi:MAG: archaellin/type IV pilin N-terminal domain-containing protein [Saccharolobus sp.]